MTPRLRNALRRIERLERQVAEATAERDAALRVEPGSAREIAKETGLSHQRISQIRQT